VPRPIVSRPVRGSLETPLWRKNSSLELSKCYQASHGRLTCISCHSVHHAPKPEDKTRTCLINGFGGEGRVSSGAKAHFLRGLESELKLRPPKKHYMRWLVVATRLNSIYTLEAWQMNMKPARSLS